MQDSLFALKCTIIVFCVIWTAYCKTYQDTCTEYQRKVEESISEYSVLLESLPDTYTAAADTARFVCHRGKVLIAYHPCGSFLALAGVQRDQHLLLMDTHRSNLWIQLSMNYSLSNQKADLALTSMTFIDDALLLVAGGKVFSYNLFNGNFAAGSGISGNVTELRSYQCCAIKNPWCSDWSAFVFAYEDTRAINSLYLSKDGGKSFSLVEFGTAMYMVMDATIVISQAEILLLAVSEKNTTIKLVHLPFDSFLNGLSRLNVTKIRTLNKKSSESPKLNLIKNGAENILFIDGSSLYYLNTATSSVMQLHYEESTLKAQLGSQDEFEQLTSNTAGEFIAVTRTGGVVYGREDYTAEAVKLNLSLHGSHETTALILRDDGVLIAFFKMMVNETATQASVGIRFVSQVAIDVRTTARSSDYYVKQCPFTNMDVLDMRRWQWLDLLDDGKINAHLQTRHWNDVQLVVEPSDGVLDVSTALISEDVSGFGTISKRYEIVIKIADRQSFQNAASHHPIMKNVRLLPGDWSFRCSESAHYVAHFVLGCPPSRRLSVRRPGNATCYDKYHNFSYVIDGEFYDSNFGAHGRQHLSSAKTIFYDYDLYGCPHRTYYSEPFRFDIDVYDGDNYLAPLTADFVAYEIHGIFTFEYDKTIATSGCAVQPQTWREMLSSQSQPDPSVAWNRTNYKDCMVDPRDAHSDKSLYTSTPSDPYEVLSLWNGNFLTFQQNGIYIFEIIVVGKNTSFCDLRLLYPVEVFGSQPAVAIPPFLMFGVFLILGGVLVSSVYQCLHMTELKKHKNEKEFVDVDGFCKTLTTFVPLLVNDVIRAGHGIGSPRPPPKGSALVPRKRPQDSVAIGTQN